MFEQFFDALASVLNFFYTLIPGRHPRTLPASASRSCA
jgi:hypothetical protein